MDVLQALILGAVQGITEFLPISSSGHLIVVPVLFGWESQPITFDLIIHLATLLAVIFALRTDIAWLLEGVVARDKARVRLFWQLLVASVPALVIGFFFSDALEKLRTVSIVAWSLIIWGILLGVADQFSSMMRGQIKDLSKTRWGQALIIGAVQAFAFIPGTSRSGSTMTAGLFVGLDRVAVARFSFLLAIPVTFAAGASALLDLSQTGLETPLLPLMVGFLSALVFGMLAIKFLLAIVSKTSFLWFAGYRIILGILLLIFLT